MNQVGSTTSPSLASILFYSVSLAFLCGVLFGTFGWVSLKVLVLVAVCSVALAVLRQWAEGQPRWLFIGVWVLVCFVIGGARALYTLDNLGESALNHQVGEEVVLLGLVVKEPIVRAASLQLYLQVDEDLILVSTDRYALVSYGDLVQVEGELRLPETFTTELGRTFDYPGYLQSKGVGYQIAFAEVETKTSGHGNVLLATLFSFKKDLMTHIESALPEPAAGLGEGLLLGVKQALGEELESAFRQTGIIHIVVLSGYNVMLVVAFVLYALSFLLPLRPRICVGIVAIVLFALMVGLSATVVRASIMAALLLCAQLLGRTYLVLRGLLLAGVVMVMVNPLLLVYDIGFQLSFMATLGLIAVAPILERLLATPRWFSPISTFFYATVATQIAVLPLLLYHIGEVSLISVVVNMLVLPMVPLAMLLTFLIGLAGFFSATLTFILSAPAFLSLAYIIEVATWFAAVPFASVTIPPFPFFIVLVLYGLGALVLWRCVALELPLGQFELGEQLVRQNFKSAHTSALADWTVELEEDIQKEKPEPVNTTGSGLGDFKREPPIFFR